MSAAAVEPQAWTRWIQRSSVDLPRSYSRITSARGFPESTRATICRLNSSVNCLGCLGSRMGPPFLEGPSDSHPTVQFSIATSATSATSREVKFIDCARLVDDLRDAQARGILKKRLKYYAHSKLLIIDELGYLDIDEGGADLLFQLVGTRYEQRSTIITTNVGIGGWAKVFGDEVAASAIADRICHHCHIVRITGRSYRLKDVPVERKEEQK